MLDTYQVLGHQKMFEAIYAVVWTPLTLLQGRVRNSTAGRRFQRARSGDLPTYSWHCGRLRGRKLGTDICVCHDQSNELLIFSPAWPLLLLAVPLCLLLASFQVHRSNSSAIPLRVASSSSGVSTAAAGRWTYLTTLPRMKTFLTELYQIHVSTRSRTCALRSTLSRV